jgi:PKD repeat protein
MRINTSTQWILALLLFFTSNFATQAQTLDATFSSPDVTQCPDNLFTLNATNTTYGNSNYSWLITGPNGYSQTNTGSSVAFYLTVSGFYNVQLTVTDGVNSESNTQNNFIQVYNKPNINYSVTQTTGCTPLIVTFNSNCSPGSGTLASFTANVGGTSYTTEDITHTFTSGGSFTPSVTVTNSFGCVTIGNLSTVTVTNSPSLTSPLNPNSICSGSTFNYTPEDKYVIFRPWPGGPNNVRMSLELASCIAFLLDYTLVIPSDFFTDHSQNKDFFHLLFDTKDLGIKTISFNEFKIKFNINSWEEVSKISHILTEDLVGTLLITETPQEDIIKGRKILHLDEFKDKNILFFDKNLLGNFYLNIYSDRLSELCKFVARHIHYKKEIFLEARKAIDFLSPNYYAIHIRRGDFQYHDLKLPIETIYNNIKNVIPEGAKLYISTDEKDKLFFSLLKQHYNIFFYDDIKHLIFSDINTDLIGPIEQIICTEATTFIGNKLSTFSTYIYRLRGYMKHITDKRFLTYNVECHPNIEEDYWWMATWARDYSEVFESINKIKYFNSQLPPSEPKKVFVSVASYRDPQLTSTIDSLLTNQSGENKIIVGVCMQDTEENYNEFKYKDHPNVITRFVPYQEAKGVGIARNLIQQQLYTNEDYFLQIDSHSKSIKNWDKILINQINKCTSYKAILSTYPNAYDPDDLEEKYFNHTTCPWLKIERFTEKQKLVATSAGVVDKDHPILGFWCAAGFLFTRGEWTKEVPYSTEFYFSGEEDHLSVLSYAMGWDVYVPESSTIWHNYTDTRMQSPKKYRPLHWEDHTDINHNLESISSIYDEKPEYKRQPSEFLELAKRISNFDKTVSIEVEFNYDNIPMHDTSKEVLVIIFAFFNSENQEIFRPDITDIDIINRSKNNIFFNIYEHIHHQINYCTWFVKYTDDTFSERLVLPIQRRSNKYLI